MHNKGKVFNIQRFSTMDGPGIRTVIFLKGCPLICAWCHNPESQNAATEIFYKKEICIGCMECEKACISGAHRLEKGVHHFKREKCIKCAKCAKACPSNALEVCGEEITADEIINEVLRDKPFYEQSNGGITLSGGEPLAQYDFSLALLKLAKKHGLHTAVETCGYCENELTELNKYTDLWLYDIKIFSNEEHIKYTRVSNKIIFDNLYLLDSIGAKIILRCPIIPDVNLSYEHFDKIAALSKELKNIIAIHLEPYHPLGLSKAQQLNKTQAYQNGSFLEPSALKPFAEHLRTRVDTEVIII